MDEMKKFMSLDTFKQIIEYIQKQDEFDRKLDNAFELLNTSFTVCDSAPYMRTAVSLLLLEIFGETGEDYIQAWLYEDCRELYNGDGSLYKRLDTIEDLYNYVVGKK